MQKKTWLISRIGKADHESAEGKRGDDLGPVASAIQAAPRFDRIHLLTNYRFEDSQRYCDWLEQTTGVKGVELYHVDLTSPIDYTDKRLNQSQVAYDDAHKKWPRGRGNLVRQVEQIRTLGVKLGKALPESLLGERETELDDAQLLA